MVFYALLFLPCRCTFVDLVSLARLVREQDIRWAFITAVVLKCAHPAALVIGRTALRLREKKRVYIRQIAHRQVVHLVAHVGFVGVVMVVVLLLVREVNRLLLGLVLLLIKLMALVEQVTALHNDFGLREYLLLFDRFFEV